MLKSLLLENFRNYNKYSLDFDKTTILVGLNGVGKTNIVEVIYLLATGRSWRTVRDSEVILWGEKLARITAELRESEVKKLEMVLQFVTPEYPKLKMVKINGVKNKLSDLLGKLTVVLFSPEEIQIIDGSPALRRKVLDIMLCQVDHKYTLALLELAKIIRGRNKLLYYIKIGRSKPDELIFWDEKLVDLGSLIIKKRLKAVEYINQNISKIYKTISGETEELTIKYIQQVDVEKFAETLVAMREREIEATSTLFGPHRDDLAFLLESKNIRTFGSRGEYRSAVLALKIAELDFLEKESGQKPVLLLDDIFSELDVTRRFHLAKIVGNQQTIITTTDLDHIDKTLREKAKIVELS